MKIDFAKLDFTFTKKPLLIGGKAMEYYGLRKAGKDIDFVVTKEDCERLAKKYPDKLKDLWGDFGIAIYEFEIWKTINYFDYEYLSQSAIEEENFLVISFEKLLLQKAMAMKKSKYHKDLKLVVKKIIFLQSKKYKVIKAENAKITKKLKNIKYVEKTGGN